MYIYTEYARTKHIYTYRQFSVFTISVGQVQRAPITDLKAGFWFYISCTVYIIYGYIRTKDVNLSIRVREVREISKSDKQLKT